MPVWGADYLQLLQTCLLPSLLAPGNLPAWPHGSQTELHIFIPPDDAKQLGNSPVIQVLRHFCAVHFDLFEPESLKSWIRQRGEVNKYNLTHVLLCQALEAAHAQSASVFPLMADMVVGDGFFLFVEKIRRQGIQLLMHISPWVVKTEFLGLCKGYYRSPRCLKIPPLTLARLSLLSLHLHEMAACSLSNPEQDLHLSHAIAGQDRLKTLKMFSKYSAQPLHHWLFRQPIYYDLSDLQS